MAKKVVVHIFHADKDSLGTGAHVSDRIRQVKDEQGVALEVYVFGPAEKALADTANADIRETLISLVKNGVPVHVCRSIAEIHGQGGGIQTPRVYAGICSRCIYPLCA